MSKINIARAIQNIRAITTAYTPVVEMIVNAIQAIDEAGTICGKVSVRAMRTDQAELDGSLREIIGFEIHDNGMGFTDKHRDSFDTLYTDHRISEGGKGFGRFICLKYFTKLDVESVYREGHRFKSRCFSMGRKHDIIIRESVAGSDQQTTGTVVKLTNLKKEGTFDKELRTVARNLVERILPHFITSGYKCPDIFLSEQDGSSQLRLNDFVNNEVSGFIREIVVPSNSFTLIAIERQTKFLVRVFKIYAPGNQRSRVSLVAHRREVSGSVLRNYIPEFEEEFYEKARAGDRGRGRNYIVKAYVLGPYLDDNVSIERGGFEFLMENDLHYGIAQKEIERGAADIARSAVERDITSRQEKKRERVQTYVDNEAPWHKELLVSVDISGLSYNASEEEMETHLQTEKIVQERAIKKDVEELLADATSMDEDRMCQIVSKISDASKNDLVHYIATRKEILQILERSLQVDESGKYRAEGVVHDILFPRRSDSESTTFEDHNLWILDERLNFTSYVSSDISIDKDRKYRPDLVVYNQRVVFRGKNEASNPITVFEFKRPQRGDFVSQSSPDDPVRQIVRYVNRIRDGNLKTPKGRDIDVTENTPFYGYVVCDLTSRVIDWLEREQDFTPMPDRMGWFQWRKGINLYLEVVSWEKILKDARLRNKIFFRKLGI